MRISLTAPTRACLAVTMLAFVISSWPARGAAAEATWLRRARSSGHVDFEADQAIASGVARRQPGSSQDLPLVAAHTALRALLYPHPVDAEATLGDLAAYHPDLAAAIDLQLTRARVLKRRPIPPDLEEVTLELPLRELRVALVPFLLEPPRAAEGALPPESSQEIRRIILRLPPEDGQIHNPPLLPSIRSLAGASVFPPGGSWFRRFSSGDSVSYASGSVKPSPGALVIEVASVGGISGGTLFLRDDDAQLVRQALRGQDPPTFLIIPHVEDQAPRQLAASPPRQAPPSVSSGGSPLPSAQARLEAPETSQRQRSEHLAEVLSRLRRRHQGGASAALARPPSSSPDERGEPPEKHAWTSFRGPEPVPAPPLAFPRPAALEPTRDGAVPDLAAPPAIRWQYFGGDGTEEGEVP